MVQMSVRMQEDTYNRFRAIAEAERRTNGGLLEQMMACYEKEMRKANSRFS